MEATIETSKSGTKVLIVPYQGDGFDEAIQAAEKRFDVTDDQTVTVIALPVSMTRGRRADICNPNYKKTEAERAR